MSKRTETDELKLLGLLWRASPAGPRSGLSTRTLTALAVDLADREGLSAVTTRRLAAESDVTAMALYPHIGGHGELIQLMLDHVAGLTYATGAAPGAPTPDDPNWRTRIRAIAEANWANCQTHPWITEPVPGRAIPGPGAATKYEIELRALDAMGLTDIEMDHTLTALVSLVHGTARAALASGHSRRSSEQDDVAWWTIIEPALTAAIGDPAQFPTATRVARSLGEATGMANDPEGAYRKGVALIIDGIARGKEEAGGSREID